MYVYMYINMHLLYTYMYRVLIESFRFSVYAVQPSCALNVTYIYVYIYVYVYINVYRIYTYMYRLLMYLGISRTVDRRKFWSQRFGGAHSSL